MNEENKQPIEVIIKESKEDKKNWVDYVIDGVVIALLLTLSVLSIINIINIKNSRDEKFVFPNANGEIIPYGSFENEDDSVTFVYSNQANVASYIRYNVNINTCADSTIDYEFKITQVGGRGSSDYYMVKDEVIESGDYLAYTVADLISNGDAIKLQQEEDGEKNTFLGTRASGEITIATKWEIKMGNLPDTKPFISFAVPKEWLHYIDDYTLIAVANGDKPNFKFDEEDLDSTSSFLKFEYIGYPVYHISSVGVEFDLSDVEHPTTRFFNGYTAVSDDK